ncbi:ricin-type beta-trefoil lectin domain protein [Streptomyces sp. NRRL WC-3744]|uniref:ricin-type beta-trefoil lectin domain protein n=1 Tax=Streptomyces sp. NRRL WC-3744 TaxID=1463935 RepID=UPI0004C8578A|nr:glycoside hydrolase family 3 N-terminal domain-containing protein [Streptomyces sp. NRRL WC-3744]
MHGPRRRRGGGRATTVAIAVAVGLALASPYAAASPPAATHGTASTATPIYKDTRYSFEERAADLVSRMTLEQKVRQLITNDAPAIPSLGVQGYTYWSEALHGIQSLGNSKNAGDDTAWPIKATGFPTSLATSMAWDPTLQYQEGSAISDEARGFLDKSLFGVGRNNLGSSADNYGALTYFAPTVNNDRDPLWGRHDESFGEDPYLQTQLGVQFVNGFQGQRSDGTSVNGYLKAAATAKHCALNNVEDARTAISSDVNDAQLRDYYTKQFAGLIGQAHVAGLMTSYNAINGTPAVADTYTNNALAKRTYGFAGLTTSDCGGVGTTYKLPDDGHDWAPAPWSTNGSKTDPRWIDGGDGYGGKCAEVAGSLSANGTAVQLNTCGTGSGQSWTVAADGTLRALGKCMTVAGGATGDGTPVQLGRCTGATSQKWTSDAKGQLVGTGSGKCLDATGPSSANATKLQIWTCAATANQLWKLPA